MSKVNKIPTGLQEYLGNTAQGENPDELGSAVIPQIDMEQFYLIDKLRNVALNSGPSTSPGTGAIVRIPSGEIWSPLALSSFVKTPAIGDEFRMAAEIWTPQSERIQVAVSETVTATTANDSCSASYFFEKRTWFPSGWGFVAIAQQFNVAGALVKELDLYYYRALV